MMEAPASNAGPDQQLTLPDTATMAGAVNDDGLPNPPGIVAATWSLVAASASGVPLLAGCATAVFRTACFQS